MESIVIREERHEDITVISEVTVAAFKELEMSDLNEHNIINGLREAGALSLSLVAEHEGCVVGHIAFSPVTVSDEPRAGTAWARCQWFRNSREGE